MRLKVSVRNLGKAKVKKAKVTVRLGLPGGASGDRVGSAKVKRLKAKGSRKLKVRVVVPASTGPGAFQLIACVPPGKQKNDCRTGKPFKVVDRSSWALIEAAEAAGKLTPGKALLYELYALDGDKRLPRAYRGPGESPSGVIFADLLSAYPTLPAADQAALLPYTLQPRYRQSAWAPPAGSGKSTMISLSPAGRAGTSAAEPDCKNVEPARGAWTGFEAKNAWFWVRPGRPAALARAKSLAREFDSKVWPKITGAFRTVTDSGGAACDPAGDSKLDIYFVTPGNAALEGSGGMTAGVVWETDCGPVSSFIMLPENANRSVLAHEFMHAVQFRYKACDRYPAWVEGTANWAMDFVYPKDQYEHLWKYGIQFPFVSMMASDSASGYQTWPFWYSLRKKESVEGIKRVFNALATKDFPGALEAGPSDGLREAWKRYAMQRWNQDPVGASGFPEPKSYKDWDSFAVKPGAVTEDVRIGSASKKEFDLVTSTRDRLSTFYNEVKIDDRKVKHLTFENGDPGLPSSLVQAFIKLANGKWRHEDWSEKRSVSFCRENADENVVRLIVATSNVSPRVGPLGAIKHKIIAKNACSLPESYSGSITGTATYDGNTLGSGNSAEANWSGTVNLVRIETGSDDYPAYYQVDHGAGGTLHYSVTGTLDSCHMAGQEDVDLSELGTYPIAVLNLFGGDPATYGLTVPMGGGPANFMVTRSGCADPGQNTPLNWYPPAGSIYSAMSKSTETVGEGGELKGSNSTGGPVTQTSTWNLSPGG